MKEINWITVFESFIGLLLLAIVTFICRELYKKRKIIANHFYRLFLRLFPVNFNIALSLDFNEGLNSGNYFDQIKKLLHDLLCKYHLENKIVVKDFSEIKKFHNVTEAEKFRDETKIDLIIWGGFSNDNLKVNGENINKINLNFTFGHPQDKNNVIGKMIKLDIDSRFATRNYWQIVESDSFNDIGIVTNDLFQISTYILALTLKLYGKLEQSLILFENLYFNEIKRSDAFNHSLIPHLINCYQVLGLDAGLSKKDFPLAIRYCTKILKFNENDFFALTNLALFNYKSGYKEEAAKLVNLLLKHYPTNPITHVDLAFFRMLEKNYKNAYKHYERLTTFQTINFNPQEVVEFLSIEYDEIKEPALLFGIGLISYYFGDKSIGKQDLKLFLKKAKQIEYQPMRIKAEKLLKNLGASTTNS